MHVVVERSPCIGIQMRLSWKKNFLILKAARLSDNINFYRHWA